MQAEPFRQRLSAWRGRPEALAGSRYDERMDGSAVQPASFCHWPSWPVPLELELEESEEQPCPYLAGRRMRVRGFAGFGMPGPLFQELLDAGFRRSGFIFYQPTCFGCRACVPIRVPAGTFRASRSQRRVERRNADLRIETGEPEPTAEKHALYQRYLEARHDGLMRRDWTGFVDFLYASVVESIEFSYRDARGRLVGVGLCDLTASAVSSVYFYSEPDEARRSLGTFSSLVEIRFAQRTRRSHYYLGYWIAGSARMAYKDRYQPCETLDADGVWRRRPAACSTGGELQAVTAGSPARCDAAS